MKTRSQTTLLFAAILLFSCTPACKFGASSPTATHKALTEALKNKDVEGFKKKLSKTSLKLLELQAKNRQSTLDEILKAEVESDARTLKERGVPATRNEKIDGNSATLEVEDSPSQQWKTIYFVKEEGDWKLTLFKDLEEAFKKMGS